MVRKIARKLLACVLVVFCIIVFLSLIQILFNPLQFVNPLRKSQERIKMDMLELTPIGTSINVANRILAEAKRKNGWTSLQLYRDMGISISSLRLTPEDTRHKLENIDSGYIGVQSIQLLLGAYRCLYASVPVFVYFAFCENETLDNIFVVKFTSIASVSHWQ